MCINTSLINWLFFKENSSILQYFHGFLTTTWGGYVYYDACLIQIGDELRKFISYPKALPQLY